LFGCLFVFSAAQSLSETNKNTLRGMICEQTF
jgi:hypothetical protein